MNGKNLTPILISGVSCYEQDGTAYLRLEDVARGLGFTRTAASGNEVVMWSRVDGYLSDLGVHTCAHDGFIPENIFYRLAMKAKNETAEKFQALVADEIIPSIRKTGSYSVVSTSNQLQDLSPELQYLIKLERRQNQQARKIEQLAESFEATRNAFSLNSGPDWKKACQNVISSIAMKRGGTEDDFEFVWNEIYESMERRGFNLELRVSNAKSRAMKNGICKSDVRKISKAKIIEAGGKKIICAFVDSVRELAAKTGTRVDKLDEINQTSLFDCNCASAGSLVDAQEPAVMGKGRIR